MIGRGRMVALGALAVGSAVAIGWLMVGEASPGREGGKAVKSRVATARPGHSAHGRPEGRPVLATIFGAIHSATCAGSDASRFSALTADDAEYLATELLAASRASVAGAQASHPWLVQPSPAVCADLDRWLVRTGSEMEPRWCSAAVALAFATASSPPCCAQYLQVVLTEDEPRFRALRLEALRAAVQDPDVDPALLMRFAQSEDVREARLSIATLARRDDASTRLAEILDGYEGGIPEQLADSWARALARSPALEHEDFFRLLLTRDPVTARSAIRALAQAPRSAALGEPVAAMLDEHRAALPSGSIEREELVMALARAGPAGLMRVRAVLEDERSGVAERLMAVQMLKSAGMPRAQAAEQALGLLPAASTADDVLTVVEIAIREPQLREQLVLGLRAWAGDDPDRTDALRETLETATMRPVRELAAWL